MIPIYCIKPEFFDYATSIKNILVSYNVHAEVFQLNNNTINNVIKTNPNAYKIIIGQLEVQNNSLCIQKNPGHCENIMVGELVNYIEKFVI